ncbi:MAG: single-stranded-DNA-specific exonuclease RecJ [FCB group bacterium]|nr:single-stranded-DNA-specific exonuclease RecJ [FCB group bacterium]
MKPEHVSKEWRIAPLEYARTTALAQALGVQQMIAHLMLRRGVETPEAGRRFLSPTADNLCEPGALRDMDKAVARIVLAKERGEHVHVFGDYDVDGIASTAILIRALHRIGVECSYALPERMAEGYGLAPLHVEEAQRQGVGLIITVDNGISSYEAADTARALGIDLIITDHHSINGPLPDAYAVVNPKREDEDHPAALACGAAVAFKMACALTGEMHDIDIAALGVVADIVPLQGENRDLVAAGLAQLRKAPSLGLLKLVQASGLTLQEVTSEDMAFQLAPRINADGRIGSGMAGIKLLLTNDPGEAAALAAQLDAANRQRRTLESEILVQAEEELDRSHDPARRAIVLAGKGWHPGVIGVVASRLRARYGRPVILVTLNGEGIGRGSARTVDGFDLMNALQQCKEHLVTFGGHYTAAGISIGADRVEEFRDAFQGVASGILAESPKEIIEIDSVVSLSQLDIRFIKSLDALQPYGCSNPAPIFACCGVTPLRESLRVLTGGHLRLSVQSGARVATAIAFGMGERFEELQAMDTCDIAFTPQLKTYRGQTSVQLVVKDIRPCVSDSEANI